MYHDLVTVNLRPLYYMSNPDLAIKGWFTVRVCPVRGGRRVAANLVQN